MELEGAGAGTNLITATKRDIVLTLLPRTEGRFTRSGLMVNKIRYHRDGYKEAYLRGDRCFVAYNPDDVTSVWMKTEDAGFEEFRIIETAYTGQTLEQVNEVKKSRNAIVRNEAEDALQAKIRLAAFIETAAEQADSPEKADIKGIRSTRQMERRKTHRNIGEVISHE